VLEWGLEPLRDYSHEHLKLTGAVQGVALETNQSTFPTSSSIRRPDWATGGSQNRNVNLLSPTKLAGLEVAPYQVIITDVSKRRLLSVTTFAQTARGFGPVPRPHLQLNGRIGRQPGDRQADGQEPAAALEPRRGHTSCSRSARGS
jgi:hypothetical protein